MRDEEKERRDRGGMGEAAVAGVGVSDSQPRNPPRFLLYLFIFYSLFPLLH